MFRSIGMLGPSFVGKTTFGRYLVENGLFARLPILTSRRRRSGNDDPDVIFSDSASLRSLESNTDWIVQQVGGNVYAMNLIELRQLRLKKHVIVGVTPVTVEEVSERIPDLFTVFIRPQKFDVLQAALAASVDRDPEERASRLELNRIDMLRNHTVDLTLTMCRHENEIDRDRHFGELQAILLRHLNN